VTCAALCSPRIEHQAVSLRSSSITTWLTEERRASTFYEYTLKAKDLLTKPRHSTLNPSKYNDLDGNRRRTLVIVGGAFFKYDFAHTGAFYFLLRQRQTHIDDCSAAAAATAAATIPSTGGLWASFCKCLQWHESQLHDESLCHSLFKRNRALFFLLFWQLQRIRRDEAILSCEQLERKHYQQPQ
jgi:hypothetical protein